MFTRQGTLMLGAVLVCLGSARAETVEAEPSKVTSTLKKIVSFVHPEVALYYGRGLAPADNADFNHSMGFTFGVGVMPDPTLIFRASMSVDRELGAPIEAFRASNTTLMGQKFFNVGKLGYLRPTVFVRLPTNDEDRQYLSYRGTMGVNLGLLNGRVLKFNESHSLGGSVSITAARNVFQYTTSIEGTLPNRLWSLGMNASLIYTAFKRVSVILSFSNSMFWSSQGRDDDRYQLGGTVLYQAPYDIRLSLSYLTADRTFQHDLVTTNVRLYKPDSSMLLFTLGYAPTFQTL